EEHEKCEPDDHWRQHEREMDDAVEQELPGEAAPRQEPGDGETKGQARRNAEQPHLEAEAKGFDFERRQDEQRTLCTLSIHTHPSPLEGEGREGGDARLAVVGALRASPPFRPRPFRPRTPSPSRGEGDFIVDSPQIYARPMAALSRAKPRSRS